MKIDRRTIPKPNTRNYIYFLLDPMMVADTDLKSGDDVLVVYQKDKIVITKDVKSVEV